MICVMVASTSVGKRIVKPSYLLGVTSLPLLEAEREIQWKIEEKWMRGPTMK